MAYVFNLPPEWYRRRFRFSFRRFLTIIASMLLVSLLYALLGLICGALINMLADELPARERPGRPRCIHCRYQYGPTRWLALGRRFWGGGRCPQCGLPTRRRALLVEVGTAGIFALLPFFLDYPADLLFSTVYVAILILVIITDLEHRLILHVVTVPGTFLALLGSVFVSNNSLLFALLGALLGFVVFFAFYWLGKTLFGPGALGFGDVTLATMMGAMVGFPTIVFALVLGIFLGGFLTFFLLVVGRLNLRSHVAYGPYLAVAGIVVVVWGEELVNWYLS